MSQLNFPEDMFKLRLGEKPMYGHLPELKRSVEFFKSLMSPEELETRRHNIGMRFYQSLIGELNDPSGKGKFFDDDDLFGWYLFLGEAVNDHPQNYEVVFGCRVVPVLAAIGRNLWPDRDPAAWALTDPANRIAMAATIIRWFDRMTFPPDPDFTEGPPKVASRAGAFFIDTDQWRRTILRSPAARFFVAGVANRRW
jgi:hypothetical protein